MLGRCTPKAFLTEENTRVIDNTPDGGIGMKDMNGQTKCAILREIRRKVCALNGLENTERDCRYRGEDCKGTCPYCDAQLERINSLLEAKRQRGEMVRYDGLREQYESAKKEMK